jgi:Ricin-type beta-trefoil lectin domain-like
MNRLYFRNCHRGWNDSRQQRWRMEQVGSDYYRIVSVDNGKRLDVTAQGKENGADISSGIMPTSLTSSGDSNDSQFAQACGRVTPEAVAPDAGPQTRRLG